MTPISFWPILIASIAAFIASALWYSPFLFGKKWMALAKVGDDDVARVKARGAWKPYGVQFIATIISFGVLAFFISAIGGATGAGGAFLGFLAWLGFVALKDVGGLLWKKESLRLVLIESGAILLDLLIGGAILGAWR